MHASFACLVLVNAVSLYWVSRKKLSPKVLSTSTTANIFENPRFLRPSPISSASFHSDIYTGLSVWWRFFGVWSPENDRKTESPNLVRVTYPSLGQTLHPKGQRNVKVTWHRNIPQCGACLCLLCYCTLLTFARWCDHAPWLL